MDSLPLSLYIHFPWCVKKCPYCDFNSHTLIGDLDENRYLAALITDFDNEIDRVRNRKLISIFMGGGTPSLFSGKSVTTLLENIRQKIEFDSKIEITLEANPGALEYDGFDRYLEAGINRLSLGVQSFDAIKLETLGRIHDPNASDNAIVNARAAGFENLNLDLMFGLPGQRRAALLADCSRAIEHEPTHLSIYQLTLEPNTLFHRQPPPELPDHDTLFEMQQSIVSKLDTNRYYRYEVSAYAKPGYQCKHNLNYWQFGDYLGIGAGAHSKFSDGGKVARSWRQKHPQNYMTRVESNLPYRVESRIESSDLMFEFMLNALRLKNGIDLETFQQRTGLPASSIAESLVESLDQDLIILDENHLSCTSKGYLFIDKILQDLLPNPN